MVSKQQLINSTKKCIDRVLREDREQADFEAKRAVANATEVPK